MSLLENFFVNGTQTITATFGDNNSLDHDTERLFIYGDRDGVEEMWTNAKVYESRHAIALLVKRKKVILVIEGKPQLCANEGN